MPQQSPQQHPPQGPPGQQFQVELPDAVAEGQYSNLMFVTHSPSEFVLDFARALPGVRKGKVYARVVMTPQHAKAFVELMERNLSAFEDKHGPIKLPGRDEEGASIGFAPTAPPPPQAVPPPGNPDGS